MDWFGLNQISKSDDNFYITKGSGCVAQLVERLLLPSPYKACYKVIEYRMWRDKLQSKNRQGLGFKMRHFLLLYRHLKVKSR